MKTHSNHVRSYIMSCVKGKNTKPEMIVRRYLHRNGFRYRLHDKKLPATPDIVLPKFKTVIFINGCFWHGHENCKYYSVPKTNTEWWLNKINTNRLNDSNAIKRLEKDGWKVLVIWGCKLKHEKLSNTLNELMLSLKYELPLKRVSCY